jgi:hypothetical protein
VRPPESSFLPPVTTIEELIATLSRASMTLPDAAGLDVDHTLDGTVEASLPDASETLDGAIEDTGALAEDVIDTATGAVDDATSGLLPTPDGDLELPLLP